MLRTREESDEKVVVNVVGGNESQDAEIVDCVHPSTSITCTTCNRVCILYPELANLSLCRVNEGSETHLSPRRRYALQ